MEDHKDSDNQIESKKYRKTKVDKIIFILLSVAATVVFVWDVVKDFIPDSVWQLKLLIMIVGALSGFFSVLSFLWDRKFANNAEKVKNETNSLLEKEVKVLRANTDANMNEIKGLVEHAGKLASILTSNEERRIAFARRRLAELDKSLTFVAHEHESERLSVSTYYAELNHLKEQLQNEIKKKDCIIWAMTGFSDDEWDDEGNDLEKYWCDDLVALTKSITTKRICVMHAKLIALLKKDAQFYEEQEQDWKVHETQGEKIAEKSLKSFIDYLKTYYNSNYSEYKIKSVCVKNDTQTYKKLIEAKGFFGIKLPEKKYVIKGEAVDVHTGLQGQYVFDEAIVNELFDLHNNACENSCELLKFINQNGSADFVAFCQKNGVVFNT